MRVDYDPIAQNESRTAARVGAIYDAIEAAAASVDSENFAEEGIDATVCGMRPGIRRAKVGVTTRAALATSGVYAPYNPNGTNLRTAALGVLAAGQVLRVRSCCWFETTLAAGVGIPVDQLFRMRHIVRVAAVDTQIPGSERHIQLEPRIGGGWLEHGTFFIESWLQGSGQNIDYIEVQYATAPTQPFPSKSLLVVHEFRRTVVTA